MTNIMTYFSNPPEFTVWRSHPGQQSQVLITAGIDGDEYAGIEAARQITQEYQGKIPLTVISCVNRAGNNAKISRNPLDGRYPKLIYPGSPWGSSSARLMHRVSQYTAGISLWIDLHGGATDEHLNPFIWAARSGNKYVDDKALALISQTRSITLFQSPGTLAPTTPLATANIVYVVIEAGEMGRVQDTAVRYHDRTIKALIRTLNLPPIPGSKPTYTSIRRINNKGHIPPNVLWYSSQEIFMGVC